jgi:hypothetical protein
MQLFHWQSKWQNLELRKSRCPGRRDHDGHNSARATRRSRCREFEFNPGNSQACDWLAKNAQSQQRQSESRTQLSSLGGTALDLKNLKLKDYYVTDSQCHSPAEELRNIG